MKIRNCPPHHPRDIISNQGQVSHLSHYTVGVLFSHHQNKREAASNSAILCKVDTQKRMILFSFLTILGLFRNLCTRPSRRNFLSHCFGRKEGKRTISDEKYIKCSYRTAPFSFSLVKKKKRNLNISTSYLLVEVISTNQIKRKALQCKMPQRKVTRLNAKKIDTAYLG